MRKKLKAVSTTGLEELRPINVYIAQEFPARVINATTELRRVDTRAN
jgi:hypothetical protein